MAVQMQVQVCPNATADVVTTKTPCVVPFMQVSLHAMLLFVHIPGLCHAFNKACWLQRT